VQAVGLPRIGRVNCARYTDSLELNERRAHARKSYALQPGALPLERDTVSPRPPRARRHRVHDSFRRSPARDFHPSLSSRRSTFTAISEERERERERERRCFDSHAQRGGVYGKITLLFAGDAERKMEQEGEGERRSRGKALSCAEMYRIYRSACGGMCARDVTEILTNTKQSDARMLVEHTCFHERKRERERDGKSIRTLNK